jgi:hypothetical protein
MPVLKGIAPPIISPVIGATSEVKILKNKWKRGTVSVNQQHPQFKIGSRGRTRTIFTLKIKAF